MTIVLAVAGALALVTAVGVVVSPRTIYSAMCLVLNVGMLAVIFLVLNAQFLFAVQLIIYAGAVMVLFVFIIALLSPDDEEHHLWNDWRLLIGGAAAVAFTVAIGFYAHTNAVNGSTQPGLLAGQVVGTQSNANPYNAFAFTDTAVAQDGQVQTVGHQLFTTFLLPFEMTSMLLFVAAIGAVYLTRRHVRR